jgi:O-antigen ligase
VQILIVILLVAGMLLTQALMGGFSLLFAIPGYSLIAAAGILAIFHSKRRLHPGIGIPALVSTLLMVGYVVWRSLTSPVEYLARTDFFMVLAALIVYLLTACYLKTSRQRFWVLFALLTFSLLHTFAGVLQFVRKDHFMLMWLVPDGFVIPKLFRPDYGWRASGFYGCPNHLAGLLETLGVVALACCLLGRGRVVTRIFLGYFLVTCLVGIAITGSRGSYLSIGGGLFVFALLSLWVIRKLRRERFMAAVFAFWALVASIGIGGYVAMSSNIDMQARLEKMHDSENVRFLLWGAALKQYQLEPVVGTGSGTYLYFGRQFREAEVQRDPVHVHNDYLELLAEYGIIGCVLVGAFVLLHLYSGWRGISKIVRHRLRPSGRIFSDEMALAIGAFVAVTTLLAHSVVDFNCHIPANTLYFAFLFGILASPTSDPKITAEKPPLLVRPMRVVLPALGGLVLAMGLPLLRGEYHAEWSRVQLRNVMYVDSLFLGHSQITLLASSMAPGVPVPSVIVDRDWADQFFRSHFLPKALAQAQAGLEYEKENPNLYYYLGEALRFQAVYSTGFEEAKTLLQMHARAGDAYAEGLALFPNDARLQFKLAQTYDTLGFWDQAEAVYHQTMAADPNLGEIYARYGAHLFLRRKLLRAEAYYRRALQFSDENDLAHAGLRDIEIVRARARDPKFVEQFGDPLENFDLETPTEDDVKRGAILKEAAISNE